MWISPRDLTSQWQDYTGTTPVSAGHGCGLKQSGGAGAGHSGGCAEVLGPELVVNGDFSAGITGWTGWIHDRERRPAGLCGEAECTRHKLQHYCARRCSSWQDLSGQYHFPYSFSGTSELRLYEWQTTGFILAEYTLETVHVVALPTLSLTIYAWKRIDRRSLDVTVADIAISQRSPRQPHAAKHLGGTTADECV
jgi:hypothetical protein